MRISRDELKHLLRQKEVEVLFDREVGSNRTIDSLYGARSSIQASLRNFIQRHFGVPSKKETSVFDTIRLGLIHRAIETADSEEVEIDECHIRWLKK